MAVGIGVPRQIDLVMATAVEVILGGSTIYWRDSKYIEGKYRLVYPMTWELELKQLEMFAFRWLLVHKIPSENARQGIQVH